MQYLLKNILHSGLKKYCKQMYTKQGKIDYIKEIEYLLCGLTKRIRKKFGINFQT